MNNMKGNSKVKSILLRYAVPIAIIIVGALFVFIGIEDGEFQTVLKKATAICMECIGIG